jgi:glycerophosphoryl diester phosphodiesterase
LKKLNELIIAHRGESFDAPENSLSAINLAWERGIRAVEIDIQITRDNKIVVIHDRDTYRISGKKNIVADSSLDELKLLDSGLFKDKKWEGERIPTLHEVLCTLPEQAKLIIEIKCNGDILGKLKHELDQSGLKDSQIEIIAFNLNILEEAKKIMPSYRMLWLLDLDYNWPWWLCRINKHRIIKKVKHLNLDGVDVWSGKLLNSEFIKTFKNAGLYIYAWTTNDPDTARKLIEYGIDGITTDRARWLQEQIEILK